MIAEFSQVIPRVQGFNRSLDAATRQARPHTLCTYDFERLYTNLPHDDLIWALTYLITQAWARYHPGTYFKVFQRASSGRSAFIWGPPPPVSMRAGRAGGAYFFVWTAESVCSAITYLVRHSH